jgi:hypothetical protein
LVHNDKKQEFVTTGPIPLIQKKEEKLRHMETKLKFIKERSRVWNLEWDSVEQKTQHY